ncbi:carnitine O-acetyltransferase isoform X2 [Harpegnathos saltator]|uniref:Carnitine O-acetyltransferase n=2 Tax=Harpegnathos saltator TaxID=610380 RepID=E2BD91_HARSA|nr:carnitine O-acetyltransferase isoform X2 [Harpegnathos saltator]XP_011136655.1 carnitine O-acetyltransferase isoform X2 [Harpegnathos saltator]EFN86319.1 Carnitine O-acetyltransferase [Harpegnathos saltator]
MGLASSYLQKPAMYKVVSNIPKYAVYNNKLSKVPILHGLSITTLNLNKQPVPKQPVPDLKQTAERYLKSLKPLLTDAEYKSTEKIVHEFISDSGVGSRLHAKLLQKYKNTDNWMREWWLQAAYLRYRAPVIVNSSPGTVGPAITFKKPDDLYVCAAHLIAGVCNYNQIVKSGKMKQEMVRNDPLDMQPYAMILGTHRQPNKVIDKLLHTDEAKHIIFISNNHFFKLCVINEDDSILSESELVAAIRDIMNRSYMEGKPVGILTGNDRDTWAIDNSLLLELGNNRNIIKDIETSLFVLCLDKDIPKEAFKEKNNASVRAVQTMTGFNSYVNAGNRWHDKTVQYIISADGYIGMEYEHSPCEGIPIAVLHDYVLKYIASRENDARSECSKDFPRPELLKFETNDAIECAIEKATITVNKLSNDIDMECFTFDKFGADAIKAIKLSPDSFIQIAMQVTFYNLQKKPPVHYESAALRRFINARTECIRSTSIESVEFAKMMLYDVSHKTKAQKKEMMIKAINAHKNYAGQAATGQGVDRHLFGLKMIAQSEGIELPELYKDIGYTRSTYFTLTSSQVPYKTASFMCYGPVVPDGYGCCYNPRPKDILFACSSFKSCEQTNTKDFACVLQQTLCDMRDIGSE